MFYFFLDDLPQKEVDDTTFTTQSMLSFEASRYENEVKFICEADNDVMRNEMEKPIQSSLFLNVMCKLKCSFGYFACVRLFIFSWNLNEFHDIFLLSN